MRGALQRMADLGRESVHGVLDMLADIPGEEE